MTGRYPIRKALSVVVAPGDANGLQKSVPTIAEFFQKNGYGTYFSGKWHLGDQAKFYPIEHGFDEMKHYAAYYPGVYTYSDTSWYAHPWFPKYNSKYWKEIPRRLVNPIRMVRHRRQTCDQRAAKSTSRPVTSASLTSARPSRLSNTSSNTRRMISLSSWM